MEDAMLVFGNYRESNVEDLFGVFDGHSGSSASAFAAKVCYCPLTTYIIEEPSLYPT